MAERIDQGEREKGTGLRSWAWLTRRREGGRWRRCDYVRNAIQASESTS